MRIFKNLVLLSFIFIQGCISIPEMNAKFREIDRVWLVDYQKDEVSYRKRIFDVKYQELFDLVKQTAIDLGYAVTSANLNSGLISAEANAPTPLSMDEWKKVADLENPRVKEIGGWMFYMADDPSDYIIFARAALAKTKNNIVITLDYELDMPEYRELGLTPSRVAPPSSVKIGSMKFWNALDKKLIDLNYPPSRKIN